MGIKLKIFESKLHVVEENESTLMREVSLETLPNVNIRDPSHNKNLPIMSVTGSINQNVFKLIKIGFLTLK